MLRDGRILVHVQHWLSETWQWTRSLDFGDVPTWLAFTGAAYVVAIELRRDRRDTRRERARQAEATDEARRQQAVRVAAWTEGHEVCYRNGSDLPVFDVLLRVRAATPEVQVQPDGQNKAVITYAVEDIFRPAIAPQNSQFVSIPSLLLSRAPNAAYYDVEIRFRDCAGTFWWRDTEGKLQQTSEAQW